jgi:hypothetical protein
MTVPGDDVDALRVGGEAQTDWQFLDGDLLPRAFAAMREIRDADDGPGV